MSDGTKNIKEQIAENIKTVNSVAPETSFVEGKLIKVVENIKSQFGDKMQAMLIVKTKDGLQRFYVNQKFWSSLTERPERMDMTMLTIEHKIIGVTTYNDNGETKVYGAEAPEELHGNEVLTVASIDNIDEVQSTSKKKASGNIQAFLDLSDDQLARLGKAGLSIS